VDSKRYHFPQQELFSDTKVLIKEQMYDIHSSAMHGTRLEAQYILETIRLRLSFVA